MYPENYRYSKDHEWVFVDEGLATVGITYHAQEQLGDIVYVELPDLGATLALNDEMGSLESVKAVAEVFSPCSGEVEEVNELLEDHPEMVNKNPHESGWLVKLKLSNPAELDKLMDAAAYTAFVAAESK